MGKTPDLNPKPKQPQRLQPITTLPKYLKAIDLPKLKPQKQTD